MKLALVSYASGKFLPVREDLNKSAAPWGFSQIFSYTREDLIGSDYYQQNRGILDEPCGAGFWAWKPFFILQALSALEENDILYYCDAGSLFINDPAPLTAICRDHPQGLVIFDARPLLNRHFTKRECFVRLGCDTAAYWDAHKVIATLLVIRNCAASRSLLAEWQNHCRDRVALTDDRPRPRLTQLPGFIQHRHDQSILSVLAAKHGLETFRNPSHWGNFLKLPEFRVTGEEVLSPYSIDLGINDYSASPQLNSPYGTLFMINRLPNYDHKTPYLKVSKKRQRKPFLRPLYRRVRNLIKPLVMRSFF